MHARIELRRDHGLAGPATEQLVAALAVEHAVEPGLARRLAEQVLRARDRIAERQVELPHEVHQDRGNVAAADRHERQRNAERIGHRFRLLAFDGAFAEVEAEGVDIGARLLQPIADARRVNAARQVQPDLARTAEAALDCLAAALADQLDGAWLIQIRIDILAQREVFSDGELTALPLVEAARQHALDPAYRNIVPGHEREGEILVDRDRVRLDRQAGYGEKLLQFAGEVERAFMSDEIERTRAERIAQQGQLAASAVPVRAAEVAIQRRQPRWIGNDVRDLGRWIGAGFNRRRERTGYG